MPHHADLSVFDNHESAARGFCRRFSTLFTQARGSRMTAAGEIVLTARRFRTQEANRADARERLAELLREAHDAPRPRAKSRLNRVGKEARIKEKKSRGTVKANRGRVDW